MASLRIVQYERNRGDGERRTGYQQVSGELSGELCCHIVWLILQFFITYAKQPSLDGKYSIFGK